MLFSVIDADMTIMESGRGGTHCWLYLSKYSTILYGNSLIRGRPLYISMIELYITKPDGATTLLYSNIQDIPIPVNIISNDLEPISQPPI